MRANWATLLLNVFQPVFDELARTLETVIGDALVSALSDLPLGIEGAVSLKDLAGSLLARSSDLALKVAASNNPQHCRALVQGVVLILV